MQIINAYFDPLDNLLYGGDGRIQRIKPIDLVIIATYATIVIPLVFFAIGRLHEKSWSCIKSKASYTYLAQYILASNGNKEAQLKLGRFYLGEDKVKAAHFFKLAADQGDDRAQYVLACLYYNAEKNDEACKEALKANGYEIAKKYFALASDKNGDAYYYLGQIAEIERNPQEALAFYRKCVDGKNHGGNYYQIKSAAKLAEAYKKIALEHKHTGDKEKAFEYLEKAADLLDYEARYLLALSYEKGDGVKKSFIEALKRYIHLQCAYEPATKKLQEHIETFQRGADTGDADSINNLGCIRKLEYRFFEARELFKKAAEKGCKEAQFNLGDLLLNDIGKVEEAKFWLEKAAKQGFKPAIDRLEILKKEETNG